MTRIERTETIGLAGMPRLLGLGLAAGAGAGFALGAWQLAGGGSLGAAAMLFAGGVAVGLLLAAVAAIGLWMQRRDVP